MDPDGHRVRGDTDRCVLVDKLMYWRILADTVDSDTKLQIVYHS